VLCATLGISKQAILVVLDALQETELVLDHNMCRDICQKANVLLGCKHSRAELGLTLLLLLLLLLVVVVTSAA
jgi:hypothetical protein